MGKFLDQIQEQQPAGNRKQTLINGFQQFFNVSLNPQQVNYISKNPRGMIAKMIAVDPSIELTYDKDQRKFRNDQIDGAETMPFGSRAHTTNVESTLNEAASPQSIQKFLSDLGIANISDRDAQEAAAKWVDFIEFVKNDLQWNYGIDYKKLQEPGERGMLIDPDKKSLFRRGVEAAGRGLRDLGGAAKNAISQQDPYNPNANRDAMGNLGLDKIKRKPNQGKIDSKKIEQRMKSVQAKLSNLDGAEYENALSTFDTLRSNWGKVKPALVSYPEKNGDWRNYISNQLTSLEQKVGINPDAKLAHNPQYIDINALGAGGNRSRI